MNTVAPRPYQERAVTQVLQKLSEGFRLVLLVAPTGAGKTVIAAALVQHCFARAQRVLFLAHRRELVDQADKRLGVPCDRIVAGERYHGVAPCVVASRDTLARRDTMPIADVVIVDEAHHVMSATYQRILERFPRAKVIGLTATPTRLDGRGLGDMFETMVEAEKISVLVEQGFIMKPRVYSHPSVPDMEGAKVTGGDFNAAELEQRANRAELRGDIVKHWLERAAGQPTVLFASSVAHSLALVDAFATAGIRAVHVDGNTPKRVRDIALDEMRSGRARVLCNVEIVTEGWDMPELAVCVLARPTASLSLLLQMWGRILRVAPGKDPIVLDHAGNVLRHGVLPWHDVPWSLEASPTRRSKKAKALPSVKNCPSCFAVSLSQARTCHECKYEWPEASLRVDTSGALEQINHIEVSDLVERYLQNAERFGKQETSKFARTLARRIREKKVPESFIPFVLKHRGAVSRAAFAYKAVFKRWP